MTAGQDKFGSTDLSSAADTAPDGVSFLNGTYEEALSLAREARDYLAFQESNDRAQLPPRARMVASCESMRVTARLTQVIAWLLVQRAVQAGEMTREQAAEPKFRLAGHDVCTTDEPVEDQPLPPRLNELMQQSLGLYERVSRLDSMMDH